MISSEAEIYLVELYNQCKFAVQAHAAANSALDRFGQAPTDTFGPGRRYQREVFRNLHSLVAHADNISRLLWPPETASEAARQRAKELRDNLGVSDDEALRRALGLEIDSAPYHERLHRWIDARDAERVLLDHVAGSTERLADLEAGKRMRAFDPARKEVLLWDDRVPVDQITRATNRLCRRIEGVLKDVDGVRLRHSPEGRPGP